ncbi:MAG: YggT family protein [Syntrophaceae bacterium]|nr:YggT family protein [Syntrophaceae bacterium]
MFVLKYLMIGFAEVLDIILLTYMIVIIARAVISWVNPDPYNQVVIILYRLTEPVLGPIRRIMPMRNIGIDFSPFIVILAIVFLRLFLVQIIRHVSLMI